MMTNQKLTIAELFLLYGSVTMGFVEQLHLYLRTFGAFVSVIVGILMAIKYLLDIQKKIKK